MQYEVDNAICANANLLDKKYTVISYFLFSLSGFSSWLVENAAARGAMLVAIEDLYR